MELGIPPLNWEEGHETDKGITEVLNSSSSLYLELGETLQVIQSSQPFLRPQQSSNHANKINIYST